MRLKTLKSCGEVSLPVDLVAKRPELTAAGISKNMHGYSEIPLHDGAVTVRSEVARLTRLYDRTIRTNSMNNPDMYQSEMFAGITSGSGGINKLLQQAPVNLVSPGPKQLPAVVVDPDQSPATQGSVTPVPPLPSEDKKDGGEEKVEEKKKEDDETGGSSASTPAPPPPPPVPAVEPEDDSPVTNPDLIKGKQPAKV
jgi:hypothetical protein